MIFSPKMMRSLVQLTGKQVHAPLEHCHLETIDSTSIIFINILITFISTNNTNRLYKGKNQDKPSSTSRLLRLEKTGDASFKRRLETENLNAVGPEITSRILLRTFTKALNSASIWEVKINILKGMSFLTIPPKKPQNEKAQMPPDPDEFMLMLRHGDSVKRHNSLVYTTVHTILNSN